MPQKKTCSTSNFNFLHFCGSFWPSWIRIQDPADQNECGSIQIRNNAENKFLGSTRNETEKRLLLKLSDKKSCAGPAGGGAERREEPGGGRHEERLRTTDARGQTFGYLGILVG
jgi:hypothetical protein